MISEVNVEEKFAFCKGNILSLKWSKRSSKTKRRDSQDKLSVKFGLKDPHTILAIFIPCSHFDNSSYFPPPRVKDQHRYTTKGNGWS